MPVLPDFDDPRYLAEVGWFLYHEKHRYEGTDDSYAKDRLVWSQMFLNDVLTALGTSEDWIHDKFVVSIGGGCTGDLAAWPAASKISVDPLAYSYQKLGMLIEDGPGTNPTVYLSTGIEDLSLLDCCADVVICKNALDHMPDPTFGLQEMWRILKQDGRLFLWVDIGGEPTPDEPSPLSRDELTSLVGEHFHIESLEDRHKSHSQQREYSVRMVARPIPGAHATLDRQKILQAYTQSVE